MMIIVCCVYFVKRKICNIKDPFFVKTSVRRTLIRELFVFLYSLRAGCHG